MTNQRPAAEPTGASHSVFELSTRDKKRLGWALALSVYYHALIISLEFGATGFGLLGFTIPYPDRWFDKRAAETKVAEEQRQPALPLKLSPLPSPEWSLAEPAKQAPRIAASPTRLTVELRYVSPTPAAAPPKALSSPRRETIARAPAAPARAPARNVRPKPRPPVLALRKPQQDSFKVATPKVVTEPEPQRATEAVAKKETEETPTVTQQDQTERRQAEELARVQAEKRQEARRQASEAEARKLAEDRARQESEELARERALALQKEAEAKKQDEARKQEEDQKQAELRKQEEARRAELRKQEDAKQAELRKQEEAKQAELKKQEEAKQAELRKQEEAKQAELKKQEDARRLAVEIETLKRAEELARQQAVARQEMEAKRQADEAAARQREAAERARADAEAAAAQRARDGLASKQAAGPAPGALAGKELAAKVIDQLRAGRVDPSRAPSAAPGVDNPRRRAVVGIERDVMLRMYVESWRWKIERGGATNYRPSAAYRASENPIVTVSIRSDGTLDDVFIHRSSGVREIDDAVRRIARLHAPYSAFPPALARQYDVIDIRRVWSFENALRILDEM